MKKRNGLLWVLAAFGMLVLQPSCKPKKVLVNESIDVVKNPNEGREEQAPPPVQEAPAKKEETKPVVQAPNYNFSKIQFELDSYVLKTESYAVLDQISREMKKDPNAKFTIYGHASIEGTADYNMKLSIDRGNAVKMYLVNSGVNPNNLLTVGRGANEPIASNDTEAGRSLNRRVEIRVNR